MSVQSPTRRSGVEIFPDRRVLIVDDDRDFAAALSDYLATNGYATETAHDGRQAIERCRIFDPLVAIVDVRLGSESGLDLIARLVAARPGLLCIMASAYAEFDTAIEAIRRGVCDYLRKPLRGGEVLAALGRAFGQSRLEGEMRAAEAALRASEERFRATFELAAVGIAHVSPDGRFLRVNDTLCRMLGYRTDELASMTFREVTYADDLDASIDRASAILSGDFAADTIEKRYLRKDGSNVWAKLTVSLVRDESGEPAYFIAIVEDISERKQRERERHDRETLLSHAAELASLGHWIWDEVADRCVTVSENMAKIHGFATVEEYLAKAGTTAGDTQLVHPEDRARYLAAEAESVRTKSRYEVDVRIIRPDGEIRHTREVAELVYDAAGTLIRTVGTSQDITAQKRAESAIRESEERIRLITDSLPVLIAYFDSEERYRFVNETWKRWNKQPAAEGIGKQLKDVLSAGHYESIQPRIDQALSGTSQSFEERVDYPDGTRRDIEIVFVPHIGSDQRVDGVFVMAQDVTERKQRERERHDRETLLTHAVELASLGHWIWDEVEDRYVTCSEQMAHIHGFASVEENIALAGTRASDHQLVHREDRARYEAADADYLRKKSRFEVEYRIVRRDGEVRHLREVSEPVCDAAGTLIRTIGTTQDITAHKAAEDALRTRELEFRIVMDNSPAAVFLKDMEGRFLQVNQRFEEWYGRAAAEVLGKTSYDVFPKEYADPFAAQDREVLESMRVVERELQVPFADGSVRDVRSTKFPVLDTGGMCRGVATFNTDITDHKRTAEQLHQAQKMEAVGQLTGGVAHDFNNLLAVILGNAELADIEFGDDGPLSEYMATVGQAAGRGAELTQRLLAFSRQQALRPKEVDVAALAAGMTSLLRRTLGETITVETRASADIWTVEVDRGQLENALLNLAINARDAMPSGGHLTIEARNTRIDQRMTETDPGLTPGNYVVLAVGDTGEGMPAAVVARAFDPFFTTKDVGKGSGLGLSMVYGFVKQSGGHVEIESAAGHGTTVRIYLPKSEGGRPANEKDAPSKNPPRGRGETVLVVEDDASVRRLVVNILGELGYRTIDAEDGAGALAILEHSPKIDLLFSDMVLPGGMTGLEIAEQAKRSRPGIKILFMTGYTESRAELADMDVELIGKPFRRTAVAEKVRAALDR